ncbi:methenyltetrahydrofolate synthase domain-containing protein isoform X3 [Aphelocoma coerulescens]|uniref:methenyltetrahydrofolate synthase domain-containing protein isoform X3 n=1 Tax=Aphelocoma coerulescens TaxID=39617 RepID=UPI003604FA24
MAGPGRRLPALAGPPSGAASKWEIREKVWEHLEASGLAEFPRPVHGRIPNFKGSLQACCSLRELDVFSRARELKVDPDKPLEGARLAALQARKTLLVPTPRLRTGLFNRIVPPPGATKEVLRKCATSQGVKEYSVPVGLDGKAQVDLVVVGSVAVSEKGWRIGKGEGYADMEYAMMVSMGAVQEDTPVVTIVHDCQVLDIAEELLDDHDLTVDYILTPTRTIQTNCKRPKPQGIMWHKDIIECNCVEGLPLVVHPSCQHTFDQFVCLGVRLLTPQGRRCSPSKQIHGSRLHFHAGGGAAFSWGALVCSVLFKDSKEMEEPQYHQYQRIIININTKHSRNTSKSTGSAEGCLWEVLHL